MNMGISIFIFVAMLAAAVFTYIGYRKSRDISPQSAKRWSESFKAIIGFLIAPIIAAILFPLLFIINGESIGSGDIDGIVLMLVFAYGTAFLSGLMIGLPIFLIYRWLNIVHAWSCILTGLSIGLLIAVGLEWDVSAEGTLLSWLMHVSPVLALFIFMGGAAGATFWIIVRPPAETLS